MPITTATSMKISRDCLVDSIIAIVQDCTQCSEAVNRFLDERERCAPCPVCNGYFRDATNIRRHMDSSTNNAHRTFNRATWNPPNKRRIARADLIVQIRLRVRGCCKDNLDDFLATISPAAVCTVCGRSFYDSINLRRHVRRMADHDQADLPHKEYLDKLTSKACEKCGLCFTLREQKTRHENMCSTSTSQSQREKLLTLRPW